MSNAIPITVSITDIQIFFHGRSGGVTSNESKRCMVWRERGQSNSLDQRHASLLATDDGQMRCVWGRTLLHPPLSRLWPHRKQQYMRQTQGCRRLTEATAKMSAVRRLSAAALPTETTRDWDKLGFGLDQVGHTMFLATADSQGVYSGELCPYGPLQMMPSAQVLNYGQAIFEGMKAQMSHKGRIVLFRPDANAERMEQGAVRMSMLPVSRSFFVDAVKQVVQKNRDMVPPLGKGSMYIRPLLLGSGPILGLGPSPQYTFVVYCAAVGAYFKGGQLKPIDLIIEESFHRAAPGGMGSTKCAGNYSQVLLTQIKAKGQGYDDVVYLDAVQNCFLEEVSSCNIFVVQGNVIKTPPLQGTILPGVTRRSVIQMARDEGFDVVEESISAEEAMKADEVFTTGTAVVLTTVGSLTYRGQRREYGQSGQPTPVGMRLYEKLAKLQNESVEDPYGWVEPVVGL